MAIPRAGLHQQPSVDIVHHVLGRFRRAILQRERRRGQARWRAQGHAGRREVKVQGEKGERPQGQGPG